MLTAPVSVSVVGLKEIEEKLGHSVYMEPEAWRALETIGERIERPKGKRIGVLRNKVTRRPMGRLQQSVRTTLAGRKANPRARQSGRPFVKRGYRRPGWQQRASWYNPRRTGVAWFRYQEKLIRGQFGRNVMKAMATRIAARFAA